VREQKEVEMKIEGLDAAKEWIRSVRTTFPDHDRLHGRAAAH
jgi:hypothetical protein